MRDLPGWVFNVDQSPAPFAGEANVHPFVSLDFEGWRAQIAIEGRQFFNVSETRDGAMLGLVELLAEVVAARHLGQPREFPPAGSLDVPDQEYRENDEGGPTPQD